MSLKGKLVLIGLGVGVGYILGAKAGRERYDQIAKATSTVWNAPIVKDVRSAGTTFVNHRLEDLASLLKLGAANVIDRATGARQRASTSAARRSTTTKSASTAKKSTAAAKSPSKPSTKSPSKASETK